ncbi:MAG: PH domain-containing protein [Candidatus Pacebacteria bacterium]|nr:PH domain-containing protein [Candidatus Paceibacterota bacterium]
MTHAVPSNDLIEYVQKMRTNGYTESDTRKALLEAGWTIDAIDAVYSYLHTPIMSAVQDTSHTVVPVGHAIITQEEHPITLLWAFKLTISVFVGSLLLLLLGFYSLELLVLFPLSLLYDPFRRMRFAYCITDNELRVFDGKVFERARRKKVVPLEAIHSVELRRDPIDQLLGLATIVVDTEVDAPKKKGGFFGFDLSRYKNLSICPQYIETLVTAPRCPQTFIPGLSVGHATILQELIQTRSRNAQEQAFAVQQ